MMTILYFIIAIVVGFFAYKNQEQNFENQAHDWNTNNNGDKRAYNLNTNPWIERRTTWFILLITLFWPIVIPAIIIIYLLNEIYNKFKNKKSLNKQTHEKNIEHEITNDDTISNPHTY